MTNKLVQHDVLFQVIITLRARPLPFIMVLGRPTSVRKAVLIVVCCSLLVVLVVIIIRHDLPKELAMSALREVGPVFRGSCLPQGEVPSSNRSIGVVILNGKKDELYQVSVELS